MPKMQSAVNNHEYCRVPVAVLIESASNPRKRFDEKSLEELAASFKAQGGLAPLLVGELEPSKYEVVPVAEAFLKDQITLGHTLLAGACIGITSGVHTAERDRYQSFR